MGIGFSVKGIGIWVLGLCFVLWGFVLWVSVCGFCFRVFGVWGLGFGVWGLGFGVWGLVFFRVWGFGLRWGFWGFGFWV